MPPWWLRACDSRRPQAIKAGPRWCATNCTLGNGTIIKVQGDFGSDYGFLSALETTASGEGASFRGTAGSVQDRTGGLVLSLGAKGEVRYRAFGLIADFPVSLRVGENALTVELPAGLQPRLSGP